MVKMDELLPEERVDLEKIGDQARWGDISEAQRNLNNFRERVEERVRQDRSGKESGSNKK